MSLVFLASEHGNKFISNMNEEILLMFYALSHFLIVNTIIYCIDNFILEGS